MKYNKNFLYKRINILDTRLLWGVIILVKNLKKKIMIDAYWYVF